MSSSSSSSSAESCPTARSSFLPTHGGRPGQLGELGVSKVMTMTSTYDHRVIQGAESGEFLRRSTHCCRARTASTSGVFGSARPSDAPRAPPARDGAGPVDRRRARAARWRRPPSAARPTRRCCRRCRRRPRWSRRTACTATWPRSSTRSAPSRRATRRSTPRPSDLTPELMARSPRACCAWRCRARPSPTRCRTCARPTAARSPTRSSTSPTTSSACGCARRSSRAASASRSPTEEKRALLERLSQVEALESYLHKAFLGKKQFSIEGLDVMVPMLDEAIELAAAAARARW